MSPKPDSPRRRPTRRARTAVPRRPVRTAKAADALSLTLASGALARLVTYFAVRLDEAPHVRALMRNTGLSARSVQIELSRLEQLGIVRREPAADGRVEVRLEASHPAWKALEQLVRTLADPVSVLRLAIGDIPGIHAAFVFGSFARGTARPDSDLDVMVVGDDLDSRVLARRTMDVGILLGREVNVVAVTPGDLAKRIVSGRGFYSSVLKGGKRWVIADLEQLPVTAVIDRLTYRDKSATHHV